MLLAYQERTIYQIYSNKRIQRCHSLYKSQDFVVVFQIEYVQVFFQIFELSQKENKKKDVRNLKENISSLRLQNNWPKMYRKI